MRFTYVPSSVAAILVLVSHVQGQTKTYSPETDSRPEIRAVAPVIESALSAWKNAAGDKDKQKQALQSLMAIPNASRLANALGPVAAQAQAMAALQQAQDVANSSQAQTSAAAALEAARPDKQAAGPSQSSASTQLVEKAGATSLLALAVDAGALSQSQSGTATTLSGNLYGMYAAFATPANAICRPKDTTGSCSRFGNVARSTSLSATFNLAQASSQTTTTTQSATSSGTVPTGTAVNVPTTVGKLSSISAKYSFWNRFNPTSTKFRDRWNNEIAGQAKEINAAVTQYLTATGALVTQISAQETDSADSDILKKLGDDASAVASASSDDESAAKRKKFADDLDGYYQVIIQAAIQKSPTSIYSAVSAVVKATNQLQLVNNNIIAGAAGNMFSFEYDYIRKPQQPDMHDVTFIWGNAPGSSLSSTGSANAPSMFSANLGVSIYGSSIPVGAKYGRLHSGQAAAEFDLPFSLNSSSKNATFTVASYWQYQPSASVLTITQSDVAPGTTIPAPTSVLVGTSGNLYVAQAKISLKGGKSGVNVPLGFKWSNKTDLLSGSKYSGQFGISYDFSSISSLFGGSSQ